MRTTPSKSAGKPDHLHVIGMPVRNRLAMLIRECLAGELEGALWRVRQVMQEAGSYRFSRLRLADDSDDCHPWGMQTVYDAVGGDTGLLRLARAWHARVMADEVVSHAFSHGFHPEHSQRLAAYWAEALGGPTTYSDTYGDETSVVRIHSGNGPHEEMDRRAITCFDQAMSDVAISENDQLRAVLHDYFAWATTTTMSRYHRSADDVPDGLRIPHWSWDGLHR